MPFPTVTLADQLQATADLLHTSSARSYAYWGEAMLIRFINKAMRKRDVLTGGVRSLVTFALTASTDTYTFTNTAALANVFDVVSITLIFGARRMLLGNVPYTTLTRDQRFATNFTSYPVAWARYNPTTVIFGPSPVSAYSTIWDVNTYSTALVATTETDPLPYPYTECVPYGAAALAKIDEQQYDEAREFWEMFEAELTTAINARTGATPNYYTMQRSG